MRCDSLPAAWAMAIVYSSGHKVSCGGSPLHLLIPFVTSSFEPSAKSKNFQLKKCCVISLPSLLLEKFRLLFMDAQS